MAAESSARRAWRARRPTSARETAKQAAVLAAAVVWAWEKVLVIRLPPPPPPLLLLAMVFLLEERTGKVALRERVRGGWPRRLLVAA